MGPLGGDWGRKVEPSRVGLLLSQSVVSRCFVTLWTVAHQAPLSMEFSKQEYWSGLPFPSPHEWDHCPLKRDPTLLPAPSQPMRRQRSLPSPDHVGTFIFDFYLPELWQNHILLLFMSCPVHDHCYSRLSTLRQKWRWSCWTYFQEWKQKENGMEYIDNCASWSSLPPRIETKHEKRKNNLFLMILMLYQFTLIYLLSFTLDWRKLYSYCH